MPPPVDLYLPGAIWPSPVPTSYVPSENVVSEPAALAGAVGASATGAGLAATGISAAGAAAVTVTVDGGACTVSVALTRKRWCRSVSCAGCCHSYHHNNQ